MKIIYTETLISRGPFALSEEWQHIRSSLHAAICAVAWPPGSAQFFIYPESGKKRGKGNGVKPIKVELMNALRDSGWLLEDPFPIAVSKRPGKIDAVLHTAHGAVALEWETGNISSSHRALNKMGLGLLHGLLAAGVLVVPTKTFAQYLTDRIGNYPELVPYLDLWRSIHCDAGVLEIVVVEQDGTSLEVPRIPKGLDGRALA